ncbi:MAG TPA: class I SAM-dependent methyltransferase [Streptosporangiaceae bacterium]|nr:class I SAM-dependent methyltransferase [Streptosporangiaceae bacterium]
MGWYSDQVVPRLLAVLMRGGDFKRLRARTLAGLRGEVLEIGFGSGLNIPFYPAAVTRVTAVEPSAVGRRLGADRIAASTVPVEFAGADAQDLPAADQSVDSVLSTWTLCSIPDAGRALAEVRRVLRPGGALHFIEHGLSPDAKVARMQRRLNPLQHALAGGCHLNRPIDRLVTGAGLELTRLETYYVPGPRAFAWTFEGVATRR